MLIRVPMPLQQLLLPETYLFGCGAKEMYLGDRQRSTLVCGFYPSLLKDRGRFAYKNEKQCKENCKKCTEDANADDCDTIECMECKACEKKGTPKFSSLCGNYQSTKLSL